ncbi:MAG: response regulator [Candidatus Eisenbacteria bacterium]|nr:response regulator [Candidatus Eisenbacteria bacterium]
MSGLRILVADDNPINQKVALRILEKDGHSVSAVANGAEALVALEENDFDLVLMDVQMPEIDGLEATRRIRSPDSRVRDHHIPIIAVTAHAMQKDREACLASGMNDYASKPIQPRLLREVIARNVSAAAERTGAGAEGENPAGATAGIPVFDREGMMDRLDGDEELCLEIVDVFLQDTPERLESLIRAARDADAATVEYLAHSIKGAAGNIGAERVSDIAFRIEKAGSSGDVENVADMVDRLENELRDLNAALHAAGMVPSPATGGE